MIINKEFKYKSTLFAVLSILFIIRCAPKPISNTSSKPEQIVTTVTDDKKNKDLYFDEDEIHFDNKTYLSSVKTVRLYKKNWELGDPVISLGTDEQLELRWDILDEEINNYQYKIIHCDKDWNKSSLNEMEYLEGFNDNYVEYVKNSFNAQQNYTHYAILFPNNLISFKKSGNYIIMVYQENNDDAPILTRKFYVSENAFTLTANVKYPTDVDERYYKQEVDFNAFFDPQEITNPYSNVYLEISQNHRPDNICKGLEPNFVKENQLVYNYDEETTFEGGNEFRHLDLTTHLQKTAHVRHFEYIKDTLHGIILNDINRRFLKYLQYEDINGRYIIKNLVGNDFNLESQYVMTHFTLPCEVEKLDGDVYIFGELSDNQIKKEFKMKYDAATKAYVGKAYLKQGYYNYNYLFVPDNGPSNFEMFEGTHFDTENDYIFKFYYRDPQNFYDRLMLYQIVNSRDTF
jgi:hypothetical protein